jgi:hypothetical protein
MRRILLVLSLLAVIAMVLAATAMPAFAQGRGEGAQGEAVGPEGGNPGQLGKHQFDPVGANDLLPLPRGGDPESGLLPGGSEAGYFNAPGGVVCTAPGSPFHPPGGC